MGELGISQGLRGLSEAWGRVSAGRYAVRIGSGPLYHGGCVPMAQLGEGLWPSAWVPTVRGDPVLPSGLWAGGPYTTGLPPKVPEQRVYSYLQLPKRLG